MIGAARRVVALGALAAEARLDAPWALHESARRASSLAGDLLATRGTRVFTVNAPPAGPALLAVAGGAWAALALLAVTPALLAPSTLDWRLRAAVAALGFPRLGDRLGPDEDAAGAHAVFAAGASIIADEDALGPGSPLRAAAAAARIRRITVSVLDTVDGWRVVFLVPGAPRPAAMFA